MKQKTNPNNFDRLEKALGYEFLDQSMLILALSHRSVGKQNNERMEFLGDSLLNFTIADALFAKFPTASEGDLTRLRAHLVKGETLAEIAREFELGEYLLLGGGEMKSGGHRRESILADAVESLIGCIYLESGITTSKNCILNWYQSRLADVEIESIQKDAKTQLQEFLQRNKKPLPEYTVVSETGKLHARQYNVECRIVLTKEIFKASASSKRIAERKAAEKALSFLGSQVK